MNNTQLFDLKLCEWNLFPILERFTLYLHSNKSIIPLDESKILAATHYSPAYGRGSVPRGRGDRGGRTSYGRGKGPRVCSHCGNW